MVDNTSPFADGYQATPLQLASTREYAKALLSGSGQQPVHHWTQGLSNMVAALVGGNLDYKAAQQEKAGMADFASKQSKDIPANNYPSMPVGPPTAQKTSFEDGPSSVGQSKYTGGGASDADAKAIAAIESGSEKDPYHAHGPVIANPHSAYYGDRAYGKYQVMGKNVGPWTKEVFGQEMTPQDFENNPEAQEAIFKAKFKSPTQWFGSGKTDGYTTGDEYRRRFAQNGGGQATGGGGEALAFDGSPSQAPGVQAIAAAALRGKPLQAPPQLRPDPAGGQTIINPQLVKPQPGYTPQQLQSVMQHPWATPEQREAAYQEMKARGQPIMMPSPTGSGTVLVDPNNPVVQQYFAGAPHYSRNKVGDIETERPVTFDAQGRPIMQSPIRVAPGAPPTATPGPQSSAAPATAPPASPTVPAGATQASAFNAPAPAAEAPSKPVQVASTDPTAGVAATVGKPTVPPIQNAGHAEEIIGSPEFQKFAQSNVAPPGVDPEDWAAYTGKKKFDNESEVTKDSQIKNNALNAKRYQDMLGATSAAQSQIENLRTAKRMMEDPEFYSGFAANPVEGIKKVLAAVGQNPNAAAPMEVFRKTMAAQIASSLKAAYGGLGQIRNKEIELQEKSNGSLNTTPAANRALVEISMRNAQRTLQIGEMAQQYRLGHDVIDPVTHKVLVPANKVGGKVEQRPGLDPEYDAAVTKFVNSHPVFTDDEYNAWDHLFSEKGRINVTRGGGSKEAPSEFPPEAVDLLYKDPNQRDRFDEVFGKGAADRAIGARTKE